MPPTREVEKRCLKCGYVLEGLPEPRCPECGRAFDPHNPLTYGPLERPDIEAWLPDASVVCLFGPFCLMHESLFLLALGAQVIILAVSVGACRRLWESPDRLAAPAMAIVMAIFHLAGCIGLFAILSQNTWGWS